MSKYSTIYHTTIPSKLLLVDDELSKELPAGGSHKEYYEMKKYWNDNCSLYSKNPNHHFHPFRGMSPTNGDKYIQICERINKWKDGHPSEFHLVREIHKKGNHKFIEFVELYECNTCGVYCRTPNSYQMPSKIFNRFVGLVGKGEYKLTELPLETKVIGHF